MEDKLISNVIKALFKLDYVVDMVVTVAQYSGDCWEKIQIIQEPWFQELVSASTKENFLRHCSQMMLPGRKVDLPAAVHKAQTVWKHELLIAAADMILREHHYKVPETAFYWNDGMLEVNRDVLELCFGIANATTVIKL